MHSAVREGKGAGGGDVSHTAVESVGGAISGVDGKVGVVQVGAVEIIGVFGAVSVTGVDNCAGVSCDGGDGFISVELEGAVSVDGKVVGGKVVAGQIKCSVGDG